MHTVTVEPMVSIEAAEPHVTRRSFADHNDAISYAQAELDCAAGNGREHHVYIKIDGAWWCHPPANDPARQTTSVPSSDLTGCFDRLRAAEVRAI